MIARLLRSLIGAVTGKHGLHSRSYEGIRIVGSDAFLERTENALHLLWTTRQWKTILDNIRVIKEGDRTGMWLKKQPTFIVSPKTWDTSALWYAGVIAHECYHHILYQRVRAESWIYWTKFDAWLGLEAEKSCLQFQMEILQELNAPESLLQYVQGLRTNPSYHRTPRHWFDHSMRDDC